LLVILVYDVEELVLHAQACGEVSEVSWARTHR